MRPIRYAATAVLVAVGLAVSACQSPGMQELAATHALRLETVRDPLPMRLLHRAPDDDIETLRLYISGDGMPWRDGQPTNNPTGSRLPLGLKLFLRDPDAHGYIGRPCYHFNGALPPGCVNTLWTSQRYSEDVVAALTGQIRLLAQRYDRQAIELIGHSGGGTLALLVSSRMAEVTRVITVAALLDPDAWVAFHDLLPLPGSLSPMTRPRLLHTDEVHFMGGEDDVVPPALARDYQQRYPQARLMIIEGFEHRCCWESHWPDLLQRAD